MDNFVCKTQWIDNMFSAVLISVTLLNYSNQNAEESFPLNSMLEEDMDLESDEDDDDGPSNGNTHQLYIFNFTLTLLNSSRQSCYYLLLIKLLKNISNESKSQ